jgi:hypothetical protein
MLDDELAVEATRPKEAKRELEVLRELIALKKRKNLLDLRDKIEFAPGYDYKALRNRES